MATNVGEQTLYLNISIAFFAVKNCLRLTVTGTCAHCRGGKRVVVEYKIAPSSKRMHLRTLRCITFSLQEKILLCTFQLLLRESLLITKIKPSLNENMRSVSLLLFSYPLPRFFAPESFFILANYVSTKVIYPYRISCMNKGNISLSHFMYEQR